MQNWPSSININWKYLKRGWCNSPGLPFTRRKSWSQNQRRWYEMAWEDLSLRKRREWDMSTQKAVSTETTRSFRLQWCLEMSRTHSTKETEEPDLLPRSRWGEVPPGERDVLSNLKKLCGTDFFLHCKVHIWVSLPYLFFFGAIRVLIKVFFF